MILHIPHSSTNTIGRDIEQRDIDELTDWYTDKLFEHPNSDRVVFNVSRFVCDVERFLDDQELLEKVGHGICYKKGTYNNDIQVFDKHDIIENLYKPHHKKLNDITRKTLTMIPKVIIVDCHSFTPRDSNQPDFCIGTNADTPDNIVEQIKNYLESKKYNVGINKPFAGALEPSDFIDDCRTFSIMIEVNKNLYMNNKKDFNKTKKTINEVLNIISDYECFYDK